MTAHQQTVVNQLEQEYASVELGGDAETDSVFAMCYVHRVSCLPTKTFRISPSGFRQDISRDRV